MKISLAILSLAFANCEMARAQSGNAMRLTLPQAIDLALEQNRSLKLAHLSVVSSEGKKEIARSSYFPQIKNESAILHVTEIAGVEIPAGAFGFHQSTGLIPGENLFIGQGGLTSYTSGTGLVQPLTQMFKIREANRAATADINTAKIKADQAENDVTLKVRQIYYEVLISQLRRQAAIEEVKASQVKEQESVSAVEQGRALDVVALESRAAFLDAKQTVLNHSLRIHALMLTLNDLLGLPLNTELQLETEVTPASLAVPTREDCLHIAQERNPELRAAQQEVLKARAGLAAAKDNYIPDITGLARYSYQNGVPLLAHNFGTFGVTMSFVLFDGGRRSAEVKESRTLRSQAEINLAKVQEEVAVQVETAYDKVEQLQSMVNVAEEAYKVRVELARLSDRQYEQDVVLASTRAGTNAKSAAAKASYLEATLGLAPAESDLRRTIGEMPR